jgi:hypothetical protein
MLQIRPHAPQGYCTSSLEICQPLVYIMALWVPDKSPTVQYCIENSLLSDELVADA